MDKSNESPPLGKVMMERRRERSLSKTAKMPRRRGITVPQITLSRQTQTRVTTALHCTDQQREEPM